MTTQTKAQEIMDHIVQTVFALPPDNPVQQALDYNLFVAPEDFLMQNDQDLDDLVYSDDKGKMVKIPKGGSGLL